MTVSSKGAGRQHSRFIPREEVGQVTRWHFGAVDGPDALRPGARLGAEPDAALLEAQRVAAEVSQHAQLQQACEEARAQGLAQGHASASAEWQQRMDDYVAGEGREAARRLAAATEALATQLEALRQHMAQEVLELACGIARQVVRQELRASPAAALQAVVAEALDMLVADGRAATVRLNPADHAAVGEALRTQFASAALHWRADAEVAPGGCLVEAAGMVVDGTLDKRWQRAIAPLGLAGAWPDANQEAGDGI